jgi:transcriptional regulator of acetoin/glycerol metabolism
VATNRVLEEEVKANRFREDLYFRLGGLRLSIPPLRSRKEDVRDLVEENERRLRGKALGEGFWREVLAYDWPGNVRELLHVLTRAGIELDGSRRALRPASSSTRWAPRPFRRGSTMSSPWSTSGREQVPIQILSRDQSGPGRDRPA